MRMLVQINHSRVNLTSLDIIIPKYLTPSTFFSGVSEEPTETILGQNFLTTVT